MMQIKLSNYKKDGEDHIFVSPYGETKLGKLASYEWRLLFFIPHFGEFSSSLNFVSWVFSGGDENQRLDKPILSLNKIRKIEDGKEILLFAKLAQLYRLKSFLTKEATKELLELPWLVYRTHSTGVRELFWTEERLKKAVVSVIGNKTHQEVLSQILPENMEEKIMSKLK